MAIVETWTSDVILLDVGLPKMDGYEVARRLRQELAYGGKIYMLSGYKPDEAKVKEHQIDDYHLKPVDIPRLRKMIDC